MILAAQALDGGRNQPETERPCVGGAGPAGPGPERTGGLPQRFPVS